MAATISYHEIPKKERKRLDAEAYKKNKTKIRVLFFTSVFIPLLVSRNIAGILFSKVSHDNQSIAGACVAAALAAVLSVVTLLAVVRPIIRREVIKAKNA